MNRWIIKNPNGNATKIEVAALCIFAEASGSDVRHLHSVKTEEGKVFVFDGEELILGSGDGEKKEIKFCPDHPLSPKEWEDRAITAFNRRLTEMRIEFEFL